MTDPVIEEGRSLTPDHLLHLLMVQNWIAIGSIEEARQEFQALPTGVRMHPAAEAIRYELFTRR